MGIKRTLLRISPYFASILAGLLFYLVGLKLTGDIKGIFISISAAFFAIPLIFLLYRVAYNLSKKRLNKELYDYAKMQVDREVLSILNQLGKIVYPLEEKDFSPTGVSRLLSLGKDDVGEALSKNEYLGFQVFKSWEVSEDKLDETLKNPYILQILENDQTISIISIIKSLRYLEGIQKGEELYAKTGKTVTSYRVVKGGELSARNVEFPDRYLLLKDIGDNKSLVADFGDLPGYCIDKLLEVFVVNERHLEAYSDAIFDLIREINNWVNLTGGEFLVDTKMFRLRTK